MVEGSAPPPLFRRGPAPLVMLFFYIALSSALFVLDLRFHALEFLRQGMSVIVDPLQSMAQAPIRFVAESSAYFRALKDAEEEIERLNLARLAIAPDLNHLQQLEVENTELRGLLALRKRDKVSGQITNIFRFARDPFVRRVYIDKGQQQGIITGQPVIDDKGVIGQVTRVFPFSAEVTLLTDKNLAVPVQIQRTGQRSVAFGLGNGQVELRYMPINADIAVGDALYTSGLDGIYPAGFHVAAVQSVTRDSDHAFARVIATPIANVESRGAVMVLDIHDDALLQGIEEETTSQKRPLH